MSVSDVAGLIAAIAFAIFILAGVIPMLKLGKVIDELAVSVRRITESADATVVEATQTIRDANLQLERIDAVTTSAAQVAQDVSALSTLISATLGGPLVKVASFSYGVRQALSRKSPEENKDA